MGKLRSKEVIGEVLASGPAQMLLDAGFTRRRLHFWQQKEEIVWFITFEVDRFWDGDEVVPFDGFVHTTCQRIHELVTGESFPNNPLKGCTCVYASFNQIIPSFWREWRVTAGDLSNVQSIASNICSVLDEHILPYLRGIATIDDMLEHLDSDYLTAHSASLLAAIHVLNGRKEGAQKTLVGWRAIYKSGRPEDQLRGRKLAEDFANRLDLQLPDDGFEPVSERTQLLDRLRSVWNELPKNPSRYNLGENLFEEAEAYGSIPSDVYELVHNVRRVLWTKMSTKQLCKLGKSFCNRAEKGKIDQKNEYMQEAKHIFDLVKSRGGIPDKYLTCAEACKKY